MNVKLCFVAEGIIRDAETGGVSAYNILESISATGFPVLLQRLGFLAVFERTANEPQEYPAHFQIVLGDHNLLDRSNVIAFRDKLRTRAIIRVQALVIPAPGTVVFSLIPEGGPTATHALNVRAVESAQPETPGVADA